MSPANCIKRKMIMFNYSTVTTLYVSQKNGNDLFTGFYSTLRDDMQGPLKTIEKALERIAQMRLFGAVQPVTLEITDDIYYLSKPVIIDESISDVKITSAKKTIISGGICINDFCDDVYNGQKCLSAPVKGILDGFWFTDFYVNGRRADFTCYPKSGTLEAKDVENRSTDLKTSSKWFVAEDKDLKAISEFENLTDSFISYNHFWVDEHTPIEDYDKKTGKVVFEYPSRYTIDPTNPESKLNYVIENVSECFCKKNEWYLSRKNERVYYIPRDDTVTKENIKAYAPICGKLFIIKGKKEKKVRNIRLCNLVFANTKGDYKSIYSEDPSGNGGYFTDETKPDGFASDIQAVCWAFGAIEFKYAYGCMLENCIFRNLGLYGVTLNEGVERIIISDNDMFDLGAGGIKINGGMYGCDKEDETHGNIIRNNIITHCGKRYFSACGILMMHTYENIVSNNEISYLYYTAISSGWVWGYGKSITHDNIIEYNDIHHIGQGKLSDMGGIYLLGRQTGTIVRNNIIHDVVSAHYGALGLYTDEGASGITFENNICYNITGNCFGQHFGNGNVIRNNIFVKSDEAPIGMSKEELHVGMHFSKNIVVTKDTSVYRMGYTENKAIASLHMFEADHNVFFSEKGKVILFKINGKEYTLSSAKEKFGLETESIEENPLFVDFTNNNFNLKENSPAIRLGFVNIDTKNTGVKRGK